MSSEAATRVKVVRIALLAGVALLAAQSAAHFVATVGLGERDSIFDLDRSNGIPDLISTVILVAAVVGGVVLATRNRPSRVPALGLAAALLAITVEDWLHTGDQVANVPGVVTIGTIVIFAVFAAFIAVRAPRMPRLFLIIGIVLLSLDAKAPFWYDQLMNLVGQPWVGPGDLLYELGVVLDEGMELSGWILVTIGLWDAACATSPVPLSPSMEAAAVRNVAGSGPPV